MLTYLLIVFVIALALAPLTHFLPSKRQRAIASMREYAAVHGLFVEFRALPALGSEPAPLRDVIYYGKRLPNLRAVPVETAVWCRSPDGWHSVGRRLPVPEPVQDLSLDIIAASVDQSSCGVYWTESSGVAGVEHIRQILERWCEALIH
jgi:hypothetical protein